MAPRCDARATAARSWRRAKLPHMPRCDPGALATRHGASGALPAPGRGTRADRTLRAPAKSAARSGARGFARRAARTARTRGPVRARLQRALSMPSRCTWPTPAHAASGNTPCQARKTRSSHGSTVEPEIRNGKADPLQAMRQRKACSSAANAPSARDPANTAALHPPASPLVGSPVSFGTSARAHTPTGAPHERTGSARPCAFRQNPGAPHQCRVNVVAARREFAVPGPRSAPHMPNPRTQGGIPADACKRDSDPGRAPMPTTLLYPARIGSPPHPVRAWTTMGFPARFRSAPSMPCPDTRGAPWSAPQTSDDASTNPEKSPICKSKSERPANRVMHGGLCLLHKAPIVRSLARKAALLSPVSPTS